MTPEDLVSTSIHKIAKHLDDTAEFRILGIDPGTECGVVVLSCANNNWAKLFSTQLNHKDKRSVKNKRSDFETLSEDCEYLANQINYMQDIKEICAQFDPHIAVVEGYSPGGNFVNVKLLALSSLIRFALLTEKLAYITVAPSKLKKFVTGKGNSQKNVMMREVYKRWGFEGSDNEVDAFALAMFFAYFSGKLI